MPTLNHESQDLDDAHQESPAQSNGLSAACNDIISAPACPTTAGTIPNSNTIALSPSASVSSTDASLHTVSSHFEGDIEHVDPFMFGYPTPSFRLTPQKPAFVKQEIGPTGPQRIGCRPAIHIRTRSLGMPARFWPSTQTPPPQTPLPPIPTSAPAIVSPPAAVEPGAENTTALACSSLDSATSTLDNALPDITEESASSRSSAFSSSFLDFNSSSQQSSKSRSNSDAGSDEVDQPAIGLDNTFYTKSSFSCSSLLDQASESKRGTTKRLRKLPRLSIRRKKEELSLRVSKMPSFRRNVSEDSNTSVDSPCDEIRTPVDSITSLSPAAHKHHRGHSWSRIKERIKKEVFD